MTVTAAQVLSAMLSLPQYVGDRGESLEQRTALYLPIAESIARVAKNDRQAALLIAQAHEDSKFARYVIEGRCSEGPPGVRCDEGRSYGVYQVSVRYCPDRDLDGQARCALKAAGGGVERCHGRGVTPIHSLFVGLAGGGRSCTWEGADQRVRTYRKVLAELRRAD
jgi:hypothetical protein